MELPETEGEGRDGADLYRRIRSLLLDEWSLK